MYTRHRLPFLQQLLGEFLAVAMLGPRQVGKTTPALELVRGRPSALANAESTGLRHLVMGHQLERPHQGRVVEFGHAVGGAGLHQLRRAGGLRQCDA